MKKALALVVALMLVFSLSVMAFAEDTAFDAAEVTNDIAAAATSDGIKVDANILGTIGDEFAKIAENTSNFDLRKLNGDKMAEVVDSVRDTLDAVGIDTSSTKIASVIDGLKSKVKSWYGNSVCTENPCYEEPAATGSSATAAIACFAAVSVAAATAFVCTKKKA